MSNTFTVSDFKNSQDKSLTAFAFTIDGWIGDIASIKATIEELQNTPGDLTAKDQALVDTLQSQVNALSKKVKAVTGTTEVVEKKQ